MSNSSKAACFIPIKSRSTRVVGKNFRPLNGKRLFEYVIDAVLKADCFDGVYIDTDSTEVKQYCTNLGVKIIDRDPDLAKDTANGNDLLNRWYRDHPTYDYYFQVFATSPFTKPTTIRNALEKLMTNEAYDSVFTAHEKCGWYFESAEMCSVVMIANGLNKDK